MKSQQEKNHAKPKLAYLNRLLGLVIFIGSVKVALFAGILFFPNDIPQIEFSTIVNLINEKTEKAPTEDELRLQARLQSQNIAINETRAPLNQIQAVAPETDLFEVNSAHAAENIPPVPPVSAATPNASPLVPVVKPQTSPISADAFQRPDSASANNIPAPSIQDPYLSKDTLNVKEEELNRREQELIALQQQMESRINELKGLEGELGQMVDSASAIDNKNFSHLIDTYVNMKPRQAATVLAGLDEKIAVKILSGMRGKQAGEILSYMDPLPAAVLSELMASMAR